MRSEPRRLVFARQRTDRAPRRRPPGALVAILGVVLCFSVAWAMLTPPWQSPDEVQHFAYAQTLVEDHALPGTAGKPTASSSQDAADGAVGASRGAFYPMPSPLSWSPAAAAAYALQAPHLSRTDGGGPNPASPNPPLAYAVADVGYLLSGSPSAFSELYAMRLVNALLVVLTALGGWLLAGEALGRRRSGQVVAAAVCGLLPMETFIGTSVNPDALMTAVWTMALWMGTRVISRRAPVRDVIVLCALTAAGILTKGSSYALLPPALFAITIGWWRQPSAERRRSLRRLLPAGLVLIVPVAAWIGLAHSLGRQAVNTFAGGGPDGVQRPSVSQLHLAVLPTAPALSDPFRTGGELGVYAIWIREGLGDFGWLVVGLPEWVYTAGTYIAAALGVPVVCGW